MKSKKTGGIMILVILIIGIIFSIISIYLTIVMQNMKVINNMGQNEFYRNNEKIIYEYQSASLVLNIITEMNNVQKPNLINKKLQEKSYLENLTFKMKLTGKIDNVIAELKKDKEEDNIYDIHYIYNYTYDEIVKRCYCDLEYELYNDDIILKRFVFGGQNDKK